jgi:hypothetical protein
MNKQQKKPAQNFNMAKVESSQIESIGHAGDTLAVKFKSGGLYHYHGVSADQFQKLKSAKSVGAHLGAHIKSAHKFTKQES